MNKVHLKSIDMKQITKIATLLLVLISLWQTGTAQESTFVRTPGYWTLGLNAGLAYQSSDVKATLDGWGVGVTLAKNLYYQHGAPIAFDLRGRALYDQSYGLDHKQSYGILNNDALSNYLEDNGGPGYVYQNHKTHHAELALEGVLSFNQLRERTNIILALYGGIGVDWYGTFTNQKDASGNIYDYDGMGIDASSNRQSIKSTLLANTDGSFETKAQGFGNSGNVDIMPAVGIELGYQLTPRFSIGLGHKLTFSRNDDLDGQLWDNDNIATEKNDWHHYTNLHLRWIIDPHRDEIKPPVIEVRNPEYSPYTTGNPRGLIRAKIKNVSSAMDVDYTVNGQRVRFDFRKGNFNNNLNLRPGKNEIFIRATNEAGSDEETVIIFLETLDDPVTHNPPPVTNDPPVVNNERQPRTNFTNPSRDNETVYDDRFRVEATVLNVRNKRDIRLSIDGSNISNFNFDSRNDRVTADVRLRRGNNNFTIRVSNSAGSDKDQASVILKDQVQNVDPPRVNITRPYDDPHNTDNNRITIKADIDNVADKLYVTYKLNGKVVRNFNYNGRNFSATANLKNGKNTVVISGRNDEGSDSDQVVIFYNDNSEPALDPPTVDINRIGQPSTDPFKPDQCRISIKALIDNIESKNDVEYYLDGIRFYDFTYDLNSKTLSSVVTVLQGDHDVRIKATNSVGTDTDEEPINGCTGAPQGDQPNVDITTPSRSSTTTANSTATIKADLEHVNSKSDISFLLNGSKFNNFSYNSSRGELSATVSLQNGKNTVKISGSNNYGSDNDQVTINYRVVSQPKTPPVVNIRKPRNKATVTKSIVSLESTVKNVNSKNDITIKVNGKSNNSFTFDSRSKKVSASIPLKLGKNTIVVTGTNSDGTDSDQVTVNYKKPETPKYPPTVNITKPRNKIISKTATINLEASTTKVNSKSDISVKINGNSIKDFTFDSRSKKVTAKVNLQKGKNTIVVAVSNKDGSDSDRVKVTYTALAPSPKPTVKITSPKNNSRLKKARTTVKASIKNVSTKGSITFKVNGVKNSNFTFNRRGVLSATLTLKEGKNTISVEASNKSGSAKDQVTVSYAAAAKLPAKISTFSVSQPSVDPFDPTKGKSILKATLSNVSSKSQVSVYLNNSKVRNFTYDPVTRKVNASFTLTTGTHTVKLVVTNKDGSDERSQTVSF